MIIIPMYICICNAVTEKDVRECARRGCCSLDELSVELGVGAGCGRCRVVAKEILNESQSAGEPMLAAA